MGNLDDTILSWEKIYNESKSAKTIETWLCYLYVSI